MSTSVAKNGTVAMTKLYWISGPGHGKLAIAACPRGGLRFLSLPVSDRPVPSSPSELAPTRDEIDAELTSGKNVVIHCRQGVGRSGMIARCLLVLRGIDPDSAVHESGAVRGTMVPEAAEQPRWI